MPDKGQIFSCRLRLTGGAKAYELEQMIIHPIARFGLGLSDECAHIISAEELDCLATPAADHMVAVSRRGHNIAMTTFLAVDTAYQLKLRKQCQSTIDGYQTQRTVKMPTAFQDLLRQEGDIGIQQYLNNHTPRCGDAKSCLLKRIFPQHKAQPSELV